MTTFETGHQPTARLSRSSATLLLIAVFLVAFFLRAYHPLSRPQVWLMRSELLIEAVEARDWGATFGGGSSHPGYTTTVIGGTALTLFDAVRGTPAEALFSWAYPSYATELGQRIAVGVAGLALVIAGLIVLITLVLQRLGGWSLAFGGAGLLAFSPFYLAQSRVFHVDALLSSLMLLSALLLLLGMQSQKRRHLILSGLVAGFAVLTKVPSLFLILYTGLVLLVYTSRRLRMAWDEGAGNRFWWLAREFWRGLGGPLLIWLVAMLVPFALWPAMWVRPLEVISAIATRTGQHVEIGHDRRFFLGQIYDYDRPSLLFYPVTMAFETSFVTLTLFLVAIGQFSLWRRRVRLAVPPTTFWLMVAYVFFFSVQMTLGAAQDSRYNLPSILMVIALAAVGMVGVAGMLKRVLDTQLATALPGGFVALAVSLQALVALPYMPNYGGHHNQLLGGNRVAVNVLEISAQNEGVTAVAAYLSRLPDADSLRVGASKPIHNSMRQFFGGEVNDEGMSADDDFHLFSVVAFQRYYKPEYWEHAWDTYEGSPPQLLVMVDGIPYVWLYDTDPPEPYRPIVVRRGGGVPYIALAWAWAVGLVASLVWALGLTKPTHDAAALQTA